MHKPLTDIQVLLLILSKVNMIIVSPKVKHLVTVRKVNGELLHLTYLCVCVCKKRYVAYKSY